MSLTSSGGRTMSKRLTRVDSGLEEDQQGERGEVSRVTGIAGGKTTLNRTRMAIATTAGGGTQIFRSSNMSASPRATGFRFVSKSRRRHDSGTEVEEDMASQAEQEESDPIGTKDLSRQLADDLIFYLAESGKLLF